MNRAGISSSLCIVVESCIKDDIYRLYRLWLYTSMDRTRYSVDRTRYTSALNPASLHIDGLFSLLLSAKFRNALFVFAHLALYTL